MTEKKSWMRMSKKQLVNSLRPKSFQRQQRIVLTQAINDGNMTCMAAANDLMTAAQRRNYQEYTAYKSAQEPIKKKKHL